MRMSSATPGRVTEEGGTASSADATGFPGRLPLTGPLSPARGAALVVFLAAAAFANSLGNGFAYDDGRVVVENPAVTEGAPVEALTRPWWPGRGEVEGRLYRPVTLAAFAAEWRMGGGGPLLFHAVNVVGHVLVSLGVFLLLLRGLGVGSLAAAAGAGLFAVHPVHVEAVANVVGQAEVLAALFFVLGVILYLRDPGDGLRSRIGRLLGVGLAYALALGSKEMAVTLPAVLVLSEAFARPDRGFLEGLRKEIPLHLLLAAVLAAYGVARYGVLGELAGDVPDAALRDLATGERLLTALTLWPEYVRLLIFPLELSVDYGPAVLLPAGGLSTDVVLGGVLVAGLLALAVGLRSRSPAVALGIAWLAVTILPVSQIFFPAGVLLAERTLYLPSVAVALVTAGVVESARRADARAPSPESPRPVLGSRSSGIALRAVLVAVAAAGLLLFTRTVLRNPVWHDSYSVMASLVRDHPESYRAARSVARGFIRTGDLEQAADRYELALRIAPERYELHTEAAGVHGMLGRWERAEELLERASALEPERVSAYRLAARHALLRGRGDDAHRAAALGLRRSRRPAALWSLLSESYVLRGDLEAALRSRDAALAAAPDSAANWRRLAELRRTAGDSVGAVRAEARARDLGDRSTTPKPARPGAR